MPPTINLATSVATHAAVIGTVASTISHVHTATNAAYAMAVAASHADMATVAVQLLTHAATADGATARAAMLQSWHQPLLACALDMHNYAGALLVLACPDVVAVPIAGPAPVNAPHVKAIIASATYAAGYVADTLDEIVGG